MRKIVKIHELGFNGEGVAKQDDGKVIFVPFALMGEEVEIELEKEKSKFSLARLIKVLTKSQDRITPPCPFFQVCGGCDLQHLKYEKQLELKTEIVKNTLRNVAKIDAKVLPCVASKKQLNYRNKMSFPITQQLGMFKQCSHELVNINQCLLDNNFSKKVIAVFNEFISKNNILFFEAKTKKGLLRYLVVRQLDNAFLFTLVVSENKLPQREKLIKLLSENFENFGLFLNVNHKDDGEILSPNFVHLHGLKMLTKTESGITYDVGPYSFLQVNEHVQNLIYSKVLSMLDENEIVVNAYSGAGFLSAILTKKVQQVFSIEINREAHESACKLMTNNNIKNAQNFCGDCKDILPKITKDLTNFSVVLDPPRVGVDANVISTIKNARPNKIFYISCNVATLSRDIKNLDNYNISYIQPFDMFPQTKHIETLACLTLKN